MILSEQDYFKVMASMPVVCVDGLVVNDQNEFLLVKRKNEPLKGEYWMPGGRLFKGERLHDAIRRKMKEELGTDVEILQEIGTFEEFFEKTLQNVPSGFHAISFIFLVKPKSDAIRLDSQSDDWKWVKELPSRFEQYPAIQKYLKTRKPNA